ncbi:SDR family oxidoreductase [Xanthobacter autotrophicus DSM 431]|uniref:SDR family oxidoreductase n=1 Tax=Xanthobacter nonsaccharivorans TaxID=3119912 RepID=UPI003728D4DB
MSEATALVVGASGIVGRALLNHLDGLPDWNAVGVSRRPPEMRTTARLISLDVLDRNACFKAIAELPEITHVFYTAFVQKETYAAEVEPNLTMLRNVVEAVERACPKLRHVQIMQGSKWYGNHLGPYPTPAREDQPRHPFTHFYYDQQAWLSAHQRGKPWNWSALRPHGVWGFAVGGQINMMLAIALYASIMKHMGLPLIYPGKQGAFDAVYQCTEATHLARGMVWAGTSRPAENEVFNLTNGDFIRWRHAWPVVARWFDMEVGGVQTFDLGTFMADKEPMWAEIQQKHGLRPYRMSDLTLWSAVSINMLNAEWDQMSSMTKARKAGWHEVNDTYEMIARQFDLLARDRIIPSATQYLRAAS